MEHNQEIIQRLYAETASRQNRSDIRTRGPGFNPYTVSAKPNSLKTFKAFFVAVSQALPDYTLSVDNIIVNGDRVMARYTITGTHAGDFLGMAPTQDQLTITGIDIFHLAKGKIIQHWDAAHQISASSPFNRTAEPAVPVRASRRRRVISV